MEFRIYTKTGDDGTSGLVGGSRVKKSDLRLEAYGTVDELNSWIGMILTGITENETLELLTEVQNTLFVAGSLLATDEKGEKITENLKIEEARIKRLEEAIDRYEINLPAIRNFILPGGNFTSAACHIARTVCRRSERAIVRLNETVSTDPVILKYINRLSDYLFVLARKVNHDSGTGEKFWEK